MKWIKQRVLSGELLSGGWLNLGSSLTAEIAGNVGFDWVLVDLEHGSGDYNQLLCQLQALESSAAASLVRIRWNDPPLFKRVLDLGVSGVMVPYINTADEAREVVKAMRYPPEGIRGVAKLNRACSFGQGFEEYFSKANKELLTIVQIETKEALDNVEKIAGVEGIDVLFVGPLDLTISLGIREQFDNPKFHAALEKIANACNRAGKAAGIHCFNVELISMLIKKGFTFMAIGSDGGLVAKGMKQLAQSVNEHKK